MFFQKYKLYYLILPVVFLLLPYFVSAKSLIVRPPKGEEIIQAVIEASSKTNVRPALLYGLLGQETSFGKNLGKKESAWQSLCKDRETPDCQNWKLYDCKDNYGNARYYDDILKQLGYLDVNGKPDRTDIPTSSTCALGFTQVEPNTWWLATSGRKEKVYSPWDIKDAILIAAYHLEGLGTDDQEILSSGEIIGRKDRIALQKYYCGSKYLRKTCFEYANRVEKKSRVALEAILRAGFQEQLDLLERQKSDLKKQLKTAAPLVICPEVSTTDFGFGVKLDPPQAKEINASLEKTTRNIIPQLQAYQRFNDQDLLVKIQDLVGDRKKYFIEAMYRNPEKAIFSILLENDRRELLKHFPKCVESEIVLEGFLDVLHIDFEDSSGQTQYVLTKDDGSSFILHPSGGLRLPLESGMRIKVKGIVIDNEVIFNGNRHLDGKEDFTGGIEVISEPGNPPVSGEQKIIVILANFQNTSQPSLNKEAVSSIVFGEANRYYKEISYGKISLSGNVTGWYNLPLNQSCNAASTWNAAIRAADNEVNFNEYSRVIVIAPMGPNCGWGGFATTGKTRVSSNDGLVSVSIAAIRTGFVNLTAIGHELGHNFGNHHASSYLCPRAPIAEQGCSYLEYGDYYDIMGSKNVGHFNALHKEHVGWLDGSTIKNVVETGVYTLSPIETPGAGLKALKIQRKINDYLFVEYRQPLGFDSKLEQASNVFQGALLHIRDPKKTEPNRSAVIDPTTPGNVYSLALLPGMIFNDPANGATITTVSASREALVLKVTAGKKDFTPPSIYINYPSGQETVSGEITVTASVSHRSAIERVDFYYIKHGEQIFFGSDRNSPYEAGLNTSLLPVGLNYIFTKAYDFSGNEGVSNLVGFFIITPDATPPFVSLISPGDNSFENTNVSFFASASDEAGIYLVNFVIDPDSPSEIHFTDKAAPYETLLYLSPGQHRVYVEAQDLNGNKNRSQISSFTVLSETNQKINQQFKIKKEILGEEDPEPKPLAPPPTTTVLNGGTMGLNYSIALKTEGLVLPVSWSFNFGRFPPGLSLDPSTGLITGAPSEKGVWDFTLKAVGNDGSFINKDFRIDIAAPLAIKTRNLPAGFVDHPYDFTLIADGLSPPFIWSIPPEYGVFPPGLNLSQTGSISGKPKETGKWGFTVRVSDSKSQDSTKDFKIEIKSPLIIETEKLSSGASGEYYNGTLSASGIAPPFRWSVSDGKFPPGLSLDPDSGNISGRPGEGGSWIFRAQATDNNGFSVSKEFKLNIRTAINILTSNLPHAVFGANYNATFVSNGGIPPYTWSVDSGSLPQGLLLNPSTGVISGTIGGKEYASFSIKVIDKEGSLTSKWFYLEIRLPLNIKSPLLKDISGNVGVYFATSTIVEGGSPPYSWSVTSGELPPGLSLDQSNGYISGYPNSFGAKTFVIKVKDSESNIINKEFNLNIKTSPTIATSTFPYGFVGKAYIATTSISGGVPPYAWSVDYGNLPEGLTLNSLSGDISGTPRKNGYSYFSLKATDNEGVSGAQGFTIDLKDPIIITTNSFLNGSVGIYYSTSTRSSGGVYPYSWNVESGVLPPGMTFATSSGYIYGTPQEAGIWNFAVKIIDGANISFTKNLSIEIRPGLNILNAYSLPTGTTSLNYSLTLLSSGGTLPYNFTIDSGSLPPGLNLDLQQGIISGIPQVAGTFSFTVKITDSHGVKNFKSFFINIKTNPSVLLRNKNLKALLFNF